MGEVQGSREVQRAQMGAGVFPEDDGQNTLPLEGTRKFEKKAVLPPSWGERIVTAIKIPTLGIPCVVLGGLALVLLPFTVMGVFLAITGIGEESLPKKIIGGMLAAPFVGAFVLGAEIRQSLKGTDLSEFVEDNEINEMYLDPMSSQFKEDIANLEERDLQRLYNKIIKVTNITDDQKEIFLNSLAKKIEGLLDVEDDQKENSLVLKMGVEISKDVFIEPSRLEEGESDSFQMAVSIACEYMGKNFLTAKEDSGYRANFRETIAHLGQQSLEALNVGISAAEGVGSGKSVLKAMVNDELKQKR